MIPTLEYDRIVAAIGGTELFAQGDVACAYGALLGGCSFFAGYPITPATEVAEAMAGLLPKAGGVCIQMEDEIASVSAIIGASWAGRRSMTATSGPGFSLMMEGIGYGCMTETPCVIVNVQRSGPSTGQPTEPAQGDMLQARWGSHGDYELIVLAPSSVQECVDLTAKAFDLADAYRTPVFVMTDGEVGHMREWIRLPAKEDVTVVPRAEPASKEGYLPFAATHGAVPGMATFGTGYHTYVTGLTHTEGGLPATDDAEKHTALVARQCAKITDATDELSDYIRDEEDGATVGLVSYGISSRSAAGAVRLLRADGKKVSHLRLRTVYPFPEDVVREFAGPLDRVVVPEMNLGQVVHNVREALEGDAKVERLGKIGGEIITPAEVVHAVLEGATPVRA
ncbi:MAG: 2-oxoacid:acceptor oxidoreductase subunit alpha [Planctomycetota bacterium]